MAARYYAAGALFTTLHVEHERTSRLVSQAAFRLADTFYVAGEGITYVHSLTFALEAHHGVASDPHDWTKHPQVQRSFAHAAVLRAIACRIATQMVPLIDEAVAAWPLPQSEQDIFRAMPEGEPWSRMTAEDIEAKIAVDLGQHPFGDVGAERSVAWSALGVVWTIRCVADNETWLAALELAAAIQIVQVEFADVDLLIIPSRVLIDVETFGETRPQCVQLRDNGKLAWKVTMPKAVPDPSSEEYQVYLMSSVLMVLGQTTALPMPRLDELIGKRMERGLPGRVFSVRPLRELMQLAQPESLAFAKLALEARPVLRTDFQPTEAIELGQWAGPGPGYSRSLAEGYLRNRYKTAARGLRLTLPRVIKDSRCRRLLLRLRAEGVLDWQIMNALLNVVVQWQVEAKLGRPLTWTDDSMMVRDRTFREEQDGDAPFDLGVLTEQRIQDQLKMNIAAAFKTWGLMCHRQTPDFSAMKRLLDERYQHSADDIPHDDPLSRSGSNEVAETISL